jgi:hypothetical protein
MNITDSGQHPAHFRKSSATKISPKPDTTDPCPIRYTVSYHIPIPFALDTNYLEMRLNDAAMNSKTLLVVTELLIKEADVNKWECSWFQLLWRDIVARNYIAFGNTSDSKTYSYIVRSSTARYGPTDQFRP